MARRQLTCGCGWVCHVSEIGTGGVKCPNCGDQIIAGRAGPKRTAGQVAAEKQSQQRMVVISLCVLGGLIVAGGIIFGFVVGGGGGQGPPKDPKIKLIEEVATAQRGVTRPDPTKTTNAPPPPPPPPAEVRDYGRLIDQNAWKANIAGVAAELYRLHTQPEKAKELEDQMGNWDRETEAFLDRLRERNENHAVPEHLLPGDRIIFFRSVDFQKAPAADRDKALATAMRTLRTGDMWDITIQRAQDVIGFIAYFKERPREILAIIEQCASLIGGTPPAEDPTRPDPVRPDPVKPAAKPVGMPAEVVAAVREKFLKLPAYYQKYLPAEERARMTELLKATEALPEDIEFLKTRVLMQAVGDANDEIAFIKSQVAELKDKAAASTGGTDVIIKNDGTRIDGRILEEKDDVIKIEFIRGTVKGAVTVLIADIKEIRRGAGAATEFPPKLEAAKGKAAPLLELAAWCKDRGLNVQREWVFFQVLDLDPGNDAARTGLGYTKNDDQVYTKEREAKRKGNQIEYAGRSYTVDQFLAMLKSRGYMEMNGQWYGPKPWSYKISNLYRDDGKLRVTYENAGVMERTRIEKEKTYDVTTKTYKDTIKRISVGKMIAPMGQGDPIRSGGEDVYRGRSGSATVIIESPAEMLECKVKPVVEVTSVGGVVKVTVSNDDGGSRELFTLNTIARQEKSYDVSDIARGKRRIYVRVEMQSPWVSADNGLVMLMPSTRNDSSVFDVSAQIADPLKSVNALLSGATPDPKADPKTDPKTDPKVMSDREAVIKNVAAAADAVAGTSDTLDAVITRMVEATKTMKYTDAVAAEPAYEPLMKYVTDPLTFELKKCTSSAMMEVGTWWGKMNVTDRKKFANHYGLLCAAARAKPKK